MPQSPHNSHEYVLYYFHPFDQDLLDYFLRGPVLLFADFLKELWLFTRLVIGLRFCYLQGRFYQLERIRLPYLKQGLAGFQHLDLLDLFQIGHPCGWRCLLAQGWLEAC